MLIAGFNTAIAATNKWVDEEQSRKEAEKEHIRSELDFLQTQISPHFFMNTLNNIHSLIESDQALAQNAVIRLSELMRYLLYESDRGTTTLKKEIQFLRSYIELMQLRVDNTIKIDLSFPDKYDNIDLPPLLFISFIENAFKHGVSYREPSRLSFTLRQEKNSIEFLAVNTIAAVPNTSEMPVGGIGLENIRKRLNLLYGDKYLLNIEHAGQKYCVRLVVPSSTK
jgi:sensor histidine kinase YesM